MSVLFATKCWERDWQKMLSGAFERKIDAIGYPFDDCRLILNNGIPSEGIEALGRHYGIYPAIPRTGNVYADGELAAVEVAKPFDYLCYVQGDCLTRGGDWITPGIKVLESEPDVMVVSPLSEVNTWHDTEGYDHYMSDQAWLIRVKDFMNPAVYQVPGTDPDYPDYGGNSFEHMVGKYLKKTGKKRKILTDFYVVHPQY